LDGRSDFTHRFDLGQHILRKSAAKCLLQRTGDLQTLQRIEPEVRDDVRVVRDWALGPLFGDCADMIDNDLSDRRTDGYSRLFARRLAHRFRDWLYCRGFSVHLSPRSPLIDDLQRFIEKIVAASVPLDFAARRFRYRTESH